jgi:hypothetical protein
MAHKELHCPDCGSDRVRITDHQPLKHTVWVGGVEVNDYYLSKEDAETLAEKYRKEGYDDVIVEEIDDTCLCGLKNICLGLNCCLL